MSVLKSIFHRYNKTAKDYDTLHPETEHAQVTDFGQGVIAHLASNVLASTISSITSDSLMAKLVKLVFNATGVQYNIAQNGYVKFGDLFGGLIIQWGQIRKGTFTFPIAFTSEALAAAGIDSGSSVVTYGFAINSTTQGTVYSSGNVDSQWGYLVVIGY